MTRTGIATARMNPTTMPTIAQPMSATTIHSGVHSSPIAPNVTAHITRGTISTARNRHASVAAATKPATVPARIAGTKFVGQNGLESRLARSISSDAIADSGIHIHTRISRRNSAMK